MYALGLKTVVKSAAVRGTAPSVGSAFVTSSTGSALASRTWVDPLTELAPSAR